MKHILFVDDDSAVLDGLRRMLRSRRQEWEMAFACGGEAALRELEGAHFDVIVTDMRMPGVDGATLLRQVRERHPDAVRMVLSGHTELEAARRAIPIAHQFLTKPCNAETLQETIERACSLRALLGDDAIRSALGDVESLPPVPRVYAALMRTLADGDASLVDLTRLVEQDPAICAKVLQLVNSAFLGVNRKITSIQQAVSLLGTSMLKNLALSVEVQETFSGACIEGFSFDAHHGHALAVAAVARRMLPDKGSGEDAFTAGMVHDVGRLVIATRLPEQFRTVLAAVRRERRPMVEVERELMGVTHAEIGAYLLGLWGLPYAIVEAVAYHHAPGRGPFQRRLDGVAAVSIADQLVHECASEEAIAYGPVDLPYLETLGVAAELPRWRAWTAEHLGDGPGLIPMETTKPRILCVDDEPHVLDGLSRQLRRHYEVFTAAGGEAGLQLIQSEPPFAVVVSDMRMPGMNGAAFLGRVREVAAETTRVLLTGQADLDAAIAAVNQANIFRFLTKPCPPDVLGTALQAAAEQHRIVTAERVLLEQTLRGSVAALTEVLSLANPAAFGRATRARQYVGQLAARLDLPDRWQLEVAAMLSQMGCVTLPSDTAEKLYHGRQLSAEERAMTERLPTLAAQLLASIPRLEAVRDIILQHGRRLDSADAADRIPIGARLLKVALDFDELQAQGVASGLALNTLRGRSGWYDPRVLDALGALVGETARAEVREMRLRDVRPGMTFTEDVVTRTGMLLIPRGQEVTLGLLERIRNFSDHLGVREPVRMTVASSHAMEASHEAARAAGR